MNRRGITFLETAITSFILIVVLIVVYALFDTGDRMYRHESILRDAQFNVRRWMERMSDEVSETNASCIWTFTETSVPPPHRAVVLLSGRDPNDSSSFSGVRPPDVRDPANPPLMAVSWRSLVVYCPVSTGGGVQLRRHVLPMNAAPTQIQAAFSPTHVTLTITTPTGVSTPSIDRSSGTLVVEDLESFDIAPAGAGSIGPAGSTLLPATFSVTLGRTVKLPPRIRTPVRMITTTSTRN